MKIIEPAEHIALKRYGQWVWCTFLKNGILKITSLVIGRFFLEKKCFFVLQGFILGTVPCGLHHFNKTLALLPSCPVDSIPQIQHKH